MDILISWSGERSLKVATCLRDWLPLVIQSVSPWFSPEDIEKGARWISELSKQLDKQKVGIICVTPENVQAPWLLFEAGALSKVLDASFVCPFLFGLEPTDIQGPLAQFQATRSTRDDMRKLLLTINKRSDSPLAEVQLDRLFNLLWPELEERFKAIEALPTDHAARPRPVPELLTEVLDRVRSIERRIVEREAEEQIAQARIRPDDVLRRQAARARHRERMLLEEIRELEKHLSNTQARRSELIDVMEQTQALSAQDRNTLKNQIELLDKQAAALLQKLTNDRSSLATLATLDDGPLPTKHR